jgi:hypothetical protein
MLSFVLQLIPSMEYVSSSKEIRIPLDSQTVCRPAKKRPLRDGVPVTLCIHIHIHIHIGYCR